MKRQGERGWKRRRRGRGRGRGKGNGRHGPGCHVIKGRRASLHFDLVASQANIENASTNTKETMAEYKRLQHMRVQLDQRQPLSLPASLSSFIPAPQVLTQPT